MFQRWKSFSRNFVTNFLPEIFVIRVVALDRLVYLSVFYYRIFFIGIYLRVYISKGWNSFSRKDFHMSYKVFRKIFVTRLYLYFFLYSDVRLFIFTFSKVLLHKIYTLHCEIDSVRRLIFR